MGEEKNQKKATDSLNLQPLGELELSINEAEQRLLYYEKIKMIADLRQEIAGINLETAMMDSLIHTLNHAPAGFHENELMDKYLSNNAPLLPQESIDISSQQPDENKE